MSLPPISSPRRTISRRQWLRIGIYTAIGLPIFSVLLGIYLIWFSPFFVVDYVEITGANGLDMSSVRRVVFSQMGQSRYAIFPQKNVWFFDSDMARHTIWQEYAISQLSIEKRAPNTIKINVYEEPFQGIWYTKGKYYKIDGRGILIKEVDPDLLGDIPHTLPPADNVGVVTAVKAPPSNKPLQAPGLLYIKDESDAETQPGASVLSSTIIESMGEMREKLSQQQIAIYYIVARPHNHDIEVATTENWSIRLNVFERIDQQLDHLRVVLKQRIKEERGALQYVDVRFDNRIYIKKK